MERVTQRQASVAAILPRGLAETERRGGEGESGMCDAN